MKAASKMAKQAAKRAAIKAIHCYPQNLEPWSVLLAAEAALDQGNIIGWLQNYTDPQWANQESTKVERYRKTDCAG